MTTEEQFMHRAIQLAQLGLGKVHPNPLVGCVIVKDGEIIGEGYHQQYGGPHAEVKAVQSIKTPEKLKGADVFVTLEPCDHYGKTPPCTRLLIGKGVRKVFLSHSDPNPIVAGKGSKRLQDAGIEVDEGLLRAESREMNRRFLTLHERKRPYIILKWAETTDGFVARENYDSKWISNERSRQLVHKWRMQEHAIMVGKRTAIYDNPKLNVRDWVGSDPTRVLFDPNLEVGKGTHLLDDSQETVILNLIKEEMGGKTEWIKIEQPNALENVLASLAQRGIQSMIVEGGPTTLHKFIASGLWDEARVFVSPKSFGKGIAAPNISGNLFKQEDVAGDTLKILRNHG